MLELILPGCVACVEAFGYLDEAPPPAPAEAVLVAGAVPRRQRQFATARACARTALASIDVPPTPILAGAHGAPLWPDGVVGSITHCTGYHAAAVAWRTNIAAVGIDAEPDGPLPDGVLDAISSAAERAWLRRLAAARPDVSWDRLLFSAKEAIYKAWFPATGQRLTFADAEVRIDAGSSTFTARVARQFRLDGRWLAGNGLLLTAVACQAEAVAGTGNPPFVPY